MSPKTTPREFLFFIIWYSRQSAVQSVLDFRNNSKDEPESVRRVKGNEKQATERCHPLPSQDPQKRHPWHAQTPNLLTLTPDQAFIPSTAAVSDHWPQLDFGVMAPVSPIPAGQVCAQSKYMHRPATGTRVPGLSSFQNPCR